MLKSFYPLLRRIVAVGILHLRSYRIRSVILFYYTVVTVVANVLDIFRRVVVGACNRQLCYVLSIAVIGISILELGFFVNFKKQKQLINCFCFIELIKQSYFNLNVLNMKVVIQIEFIEHLKKILSICSF